MRKHREYCILLLILALVMLFSLFGCGNVSDSSEAKGGFYNVCGVYYPEELGAPMLGDTVVEFDVSEAAEKITAVGDALYYIDSADLSGYLGDKCSLFADLVIYDYDEVGTIRVSLNGWEESYTIVYVKDGENYYPFDPQYMEDSVLLKTRKKCTAADDLDSLRMRMVASFPREEGVHIDSEIKTLSNLTKDEYATIKRIVTHNYTEEQIQQWVEDGLTLDEWAENITTPADAIQMLRAIKYRENADTAPDDNFGFWDECLGINWCGIWNAQLVFDYRNGNCGGTSTIFNYLLAGDFEEQGYVEFSSAAGGHIFNYFLINGVYVVCDFVGIPGINHYDNDEEVNSLVDASSAILYVGSNAEEFGNWYREEGPFANNFENSNSEDFLYSLFMYPREGTKIPKGEDENSLRTQFNMVCDILPEQYKDQYTILFEREGYPVRFAPIPDESTWPAEIR